MLQFVELNKTAFVDRDHFRLFCNSYLLPKPFLCVNKMFEGLGEKAPKVPQGSGPKLQAAFLEDHNYLCQ